MKNGKYEKREFTSVGLNPESRKMLEAIVEASAGTLTRNRIINAVLRLYGEKYMQNIKRVFEEK